MARRTVSVREVKQAYKVTGLEPMTDSYCADGHACALGAIAAKLHGTDFAEDMGNDWAEARYGKGYEGGFTMGFDGRGKGALSDWITDCLSGQARAIRRAYEGFRAGRKVRRAIFGKAA